MNAPKFNPGNNVLVRNDADNEVRGAVVLSVWFNHRDQDWVYNITEGSSRFMTNHIKEKDILGPYSVSKLLHYVNKGS